MDGRTQGLPPEIEEIIRAVLKSANLHLVDGVDEVARELRAHFEDGLASGTTADELIAKFGDPAVAGTRIRRARPRPRVRRTVPAASPPART